MRDFSVKFFFNNIISLTLDQRHMCNTFRSDLINYLCYFEKAVFLPFDIMIKREQIEECWLQI